MAVDDTPSSRRTATLADSIRARVMVEARYLSRAIALLVIEGHAS
jgi:hypothetical protein